MEELAELGLTLESTIIHNNRKDELSKLINKVYELDQSLEAWQRSFHELWQADQDSGEEVLNNMCASYIDNRTSSLRSVCECIVRTSYITFLARCRAADALGNLFYHLEILQDYMNNPKEDINFTMFIDYVTRMIQYLEFTDETLEPLLAWIFTTNFIAWINKYKLYKELCMLRVKSISMLQRLGKVLISSNTLSNFTVLCLQLIKFDERTLKSILMRTKTIRDVRVKADVYDHFLLYPSLKNEALKELKRLGEGLRTLDSSQNVHMISADVERWISTTLVPVVIKTTEEHNQLYAALKEELVNLASATDTRDVTKLEYALQRLELDNSTYGSLHYKLMTILVKVWRIIDGHESRSELLKRLYEELVEMSETCSTGHLYRLMNVFSGFDNSFITLDPSVELRSVINKRIQNYLSTMSDEDQEEVMKAWMDGDNEDSEGILVKKLYAQLARIHDEMFADYVGQGLMNQQDFSTYYRDILNKLFVN